MLRPVTRLAPLRACARIQRRHKQQKQQSAPPSEALDEILNTGSDNAAGRLAAIRLDGSTPDGLARKGEIIAHMAARTNVMPPAMQLSAASTAHDVLRAFEAAAGRAPLVLEPTKQAYVALAAQQKLPPNLRFIVYNPRLERLYRYLY